MSSPTMPRPPASASGRWLGKADLWSGLAAVAFGLSMLYISADYGLGRAGRIGPGYVPLVIGLAIVTLGALLIGRSGVTSDPVDTDIAWPQLLLVIGSILTFALLLDRVGLMLAIPATVIVAAPAARGNTVLSVIISGALLAAFSWFLFVYFLKIAIPVWWF